MSWSLQIADGDLNLGTGGLATVQGPAKLVQDLSCAILEPLGHDPMHPTFGSVIDGGVDAQGTTYAGVIGGYNDTESATLVQGEIQRICETYQHQQVTRNANDITIYGKSTLTANEVLLAVGGITVQQIEDNMMVQTTLETGTGDTPLNVPISAS